MFSINFYCSWKGGDDKQRRVDWTRKTERKTENMERKYISVIQAGQKWVFDHNCQDLVWRGGRHTGEEPAWHRAPHPHPAPLPPLPLPPTSSWVDHRLIISQIIVFLSSTNITRVSFSIIFFPEISSMFLTLTFRSLLTDRLVDCQLWSLIFATTI